VLQGALEDDRIKAEWWDVPKHGRSTKGTIELQVSQQGTRLTRKSADTAIGVSVLTRIDPASVPWPKTDREAGFQSTSINDLDGKWIGGDGRRTYLREIGSSVVGVSELRTGSNTRPVWATVFVGARKANGDVAGTYADVPKGLRAEDGSLAIVQVTGTRRLAVAQAGISPGGIQEPDYAVDFTRMRTLVKQSLAGRVVGYGFAVSKNEAIVAEGAGGFRRLGQDDPSGNNEALSFNVTTQVETASTAKLVTAAMLIRTLAERGISLDAKVAGALPSCWERGPGIVNTMGGLTWKQLLNHTSRLTRPSECSSNPYECLRKSIAAGRIGPATDANGNARQYQNINYTVLRYMLPTLRDRPAIEAIFDKYDCKSSNGAKINAEVSERFRRYVSDDVLAPLGVVGTFEPVTEFAIRYDFSKPTAQGIRPSYDDILSAGSGGMKFSARDYAKFLAALETGRIVPLSWLRTMRSELLGYDTTFDGAAGDYPTKNGGDDGVQTRTVSFPSGIAAYVAVNSTSNNLSRSLGEVLRDAFDASIR
jgi:CubicO group peptidase (beta-lactamase class C family)